MKTFRIDGTTALITGAGTGMGRACALALAQAGASRLFLCGRREAPLREAAQEVSARVPTCQVELLSADVTAAEDRQKLERCVEAGGRLDFIVNNAGYFEGKGLRDTSDGIWRRTFAINVEAPFQLIRELVDTLKKSPAPSIVNISSTLAVKPIPETAAYNASKAALVQLSRSLALELAPEGIRVNSILPAIVETPMYRGRFTDEQAYASGLEEAAKLHPLGRVGRPEDVAHAVLFLLSPAAAWITGVALPVDGGMLVT